MSTAFLNGTARQIESGESIYDFVSRHLGKNEIPVLCHDPALEPFGACRMCLVEVALEKNGQKKLLASCHTPMAASLHITSKSERISKTRKGILQLLLSQYPQDRLEPADQELPTPFQSMLAEYGITSTPYRLNHEPGMSENSHTYIRFDPSECIHCYRCIRACDEIQGEFVLSMANRGIKSHIVQGLTGTFSQAGCVSCGRCVQTCPTNALTERYRSKTCQYDRKIKTICTYCGVGCNLDVKVRDDRVVGIDGHEAATANQGHTCLKGRFAFEFAHHRDRLTSPLIKKKGELVEASWDEALDLIASRLGAIRKEFGPDAIAGISSARCTNEENYLMQKLMRAVIGTNNIDGCARVCHAPTAWGMQQTLGTGAATNSIDEIPVTDCLLIMGANPSYAHPVTGAKLKQASLKGTPLIVIDPVQTPLARLATVHLQLKPGSNIPLLQMFCALLLQYKLIDEDFVKRRTSGFEVFCDKIRALDLNDLENLTGIARTRVEKAVLIYGRAKSAMSFHGLGVTEHFQGSRSVMLLTDIAMMTGNLGRPGTGINPLRGQNNVQGAADMGVQPHQGAGYLDVTDPQMQKLYANHYGTPVPGHIGLKIPEMFGAARDGRLKALWIIGEDVLQTDPNSCEVKYSLSCLDFLVVQELFMTQTCTMADIVLPASSFLEKSGTFTNGDRRVQRVNAAISPRPGTRPDGQIICDVMNRMGYRQGPYDPALVLGEISRIAPFFAGITWENIEKNGKQWPVGSDGADTPILHEEHFKFADGLARFQFFDYEASPELAKLGDQYPYILTTGRILEHYNCGSMTRRTPNVELVDHDVLLMNPLDGDREDVADGDLVEITSSNGTTRLHVRLTKKVNPGVLFTTFHFPEIAINHLTSDVFEQVTMTPEYKIVAVAVKPADKTQND
jgi:formate dehydrogenase major subunit